MAARSSSAGRPEPGFENMSHFVLDTEQLVVMLENMDFGSGEQWRDRQEDGRLCCDFVWPFSSGADNGDSGDSEEGSEVDFAPRYEELDSFSLFEVRNSN